MSEVSLATATELDEKARGLIANGLRIAAEKYGESARVCREERHEALAKTFDKQKADSEALAQNFECASECRIF